MSGASSVSRGNTLEEAPCLKMMRVVLGSKAILNLQARIMCIA
jgi:hypothetical protein